VRPIFNRSNVTYDLKAKKPKDLKAKIKSISPMGDVIVSFSSELAVPGNYTQIGEDVLNIKIKPGYDSNPKLLKIDSWNITGKAILIIIS
jgi:hypothetical protein